MAPDPSVRKEVERQLHGLRAVLFEQMPQQIRGGAVEPSQWRGAHEADACLSTNRFRYPRPVMASFEDLLRWFMGATNEFPSWMRSAVSAGRRGDPEAERELRARIEQLWAEYDEHAHGVMEAVDTADAVEQVEPRPEFDLALSFAGEDRKYVEKWLNCSAKPE